MVGIKPCLGGQPNPSQRDESVKAQYYIYKKDGFLGLRDG